MWKSRCTKQQAIVLFRVATDPTIGVVLKGAYRQNCCPVSRHMYQCQESTCAPLTLIAG